MTEIILVVPYISGCKVIARDARLKQSAEG